MKLNIMNDAFRQRAITELLGTINNIYIILCNTAGSLSTKRSSLPDTAEMEVAIKASEILYLIKQSLLFEQPSGSSEITLRGIPYYAISDITGLENYNWNSIYLKFESTGDNGTFDTNAISIVTNIGSIIIPEFDFTQSDVMLQYGAMSEYPTPVDTLDPGLVFATEEDLIENWHPVDAGEYAVVTGYQWVQSNAGEYAAADFQVNKTLLIYSPTSKEEATEICFPTEMNLRRPYPETDTLVMRINNGIGYDYWKISCEEGTCRTFYDVYVSAEASPEIIDATKLAPSNFDDSTTIAQSSFPEITYDTTDKTIETIIKF